MRGEPDLGGGRVFGGSTCVPDNCVECQREGSMDGRVNGGTVPKDERRTISPALAALRATHLVLSGFGGL